MADGSWCATWLREKGYFVAWKDSVRCYVGVPYPIPVGAPIDEADILTAKTVQEMDAQIDEHNARRKG